VEARGYLTLDPRRYMDRQLSIVLPIIIVLIGGFFKHSYARQGPHHSIERPRVCTHFPRQLSHRDPLPIHVIGYAQPRNRGYEKPTEKGARHGLDNGKEARNEYQ